SDHHFGGRRAGGAPLRNVASAAGQLAERSHRVQSRGRSPREANLFEQRSGVGVGHVGAPIKIDRGQPGARGRENKIRSAPCEARLFGKFAAPGGRAQPPMGSSSCGLASYTTSSPSRRANGVTW